MPVVSIGPGFREWELEYGWKYPSTSTQIKHHREGVSIVSSVLFYLDSIADHTLVSTLAPYIKRGTPNVYVFMGYEHMPNTEALLKERLGCIKINEKN